MFCCSCGSECSSFVNFCAHYGHQINDAIEQTSTHTVDIEELIKEYFHGGYSYIPSLVCSGLLEKQNGVQMHFQTLKRKLKVLLRSNL